MSLIFLFGPGAMEVAKSFVAKDNGDKEMVEKRIPEEMVVVVCLADLARHVIPHDLISKDSPHG